MSVPGERLGVGGRAGDRVKQLRAFCHSVRLGSFTRAADHLASNQSSVSQQVRALESELGLTLFERRGPNLRLTEIGHELFRIALPVVMDMDRLRNSFEERYRRISSGWLAIAASNTLAMKVVAGYLKQLREEHPGYRVKMLIGGGKERVAWLRDYEAEVAFGAMDFMPLDLEFRHLFTSRTVLITPAGHPLAGNKAPNLAELASFPMIAHPPGHETRSLVDAVARHGGTRFEVVMGLRGWEVIKRHVEMGVGVAFVPEYALDESDRIERISFDESFPARRYGVYRRREGALSLPAQRLFALLGPTFPAAG